MQTPTHILVAFAVLGNPDQRARTGAVLTGALVPDVSIYVLFLWSKLRGIPESDVWHKLYWQEPWQVLSALSNSMPLWTMVLIAGLALRKPLIWALAAAALLHLALDFPVHHDDAHKHFWPFTDWRFQSPLSYWDPAHHGRLVSLLEAVLGTLCALALWVRFESRWIRWMLVLSVLAYVAVPLYFSLALG